MRNHPLFVVGLLSGFFAVMAPAFAQETYPSRPITMIVPFAPGGTTDAIARVVAEGLRHVLGQPVTVDNRGGAGGSLGTAAIVSAAPDGYTIGMGTVSTLAINPATYKNLSYDVRADLVPVGKIADVPNIMSINPSLDARDMSAFIALARQEPGKLSYASAGNGSLGHLLGAQFLLATGTDIVHVPYRGAGPALVDVVAGQVDVMFDNLPTSLPLAREGHLRALAVSGAARIEGLPDVPTFAELGMNDMNWMGFFGLVVPKGTPDPIVRRLNAALMEALATPQVRERLEAQQAIVAGSSPEAFKSEIESALEDMREAVEASGIRMD
ncbi:MAG: tripartite tricarboxylate transporter substrate binding protein [Rhizobiaceae bacterium]|nr:tripartite tricarboxylate transporter substrate binding protein [Rhizobiaceae bacterium]